MIDEWLVRSPWPIIPIWAASYCADYYLTIWSARLYLFLFALAQSWFLLGGAFGCAVIAVQHWKLAAKAQGTSP